jgi:hypothetical protein
MIIAGSGAGSKSGSVSQSYGSLDTDPYKNTTDPQPATMSHKVTVLKYFYLYRSCESRELCGTDAEAEDAVEEA